MVPRGVSLLISSSYRLMCSQSYSAKFTYSAILKLTCSFHCGFDPPLRTTLLCRFSPPMQKEAYMLARPRPMNSCPLMPLARFKWIISSPALIVVLGPETSSKVSITISQSYKPYAAVLQATFCQNSGH
ncbi:hypothetical protein Mapa_009368 [Marchantia paleacea]|nr:hypothetical protein Mapa_009368 [Marchantia paleacea]